MTKTEIAHGIRCGGALELLVVCKMIATTGMKGRHQ